jgi:retron-type reverse transcriptase
MDIVKLFRAYFDCRKNKRNTANAINFELDYESNLIRLHEEVMDRTYRVGKSIAFIVDKPVKREIFAGDFRDRIVHHFIINELNAIFEKTFIHDSYSCRMGKGTSFGIHRMEKVIRASSDNFTAKAWVLKFDIMGFFMSIDRSVLLSMIEKIIEDKYG